MGNHVPRNELLAVLHEFAAEERAGEQARARSIAARILTRSQLAELPEPDPLIADTLDQHSVVLLAGPWGSGKSFIALDWSARLSCGLPWQGRPVHATGTVLYVAAEGAYGLKKRLDAWEHGWHRTLTDSGFLVLTRPVNLLSQAEVAELCEQIYTRGIRFVVIDTLARCLVGGDENSAKDMGAAVDALYRIREATGAGGAVIAIHHTGKDRATVRGSSALEAGVDTVYQTDGDAEHIQLTRTKRKDGPVEDTMPLSLNPVLDSVVVRLHSEGGTTRNEQELSSTLQSHFQHLPAPTAKTLMDVTGIPSSSFYRALNRLADRGFVRLETKGRSTWVHLTGQPCE